MLRDPSREDLRTLSLTGRGEIASDLAPPAFGNPPTTIPRWSALAYASATRRRVSNAQPAAIGSSIMNPGSGTSVTVRLSATKLSLTGSPVRVKFKLSIGDVSIDVKSVAVSPTPNLGLARARLDGWVSSCWQWVA